MDAELEQLLDRLHQLQLYPEPTRAPSRKKAPEINDLYKAVRALIVNFPKGAWTVTKEQAPLRPLVDCFPGNYIEHRTAAMLELTIDVSTNKDFWKRVLTLTQSKTETAEVRLGVSHDEYPRRCNERVRELANYLRRAHNALSAPSPPQPAPVPEVVSDEDRQEAEGAPCDQAPKLTLPIRQLSLSTLHPDHLELWVTDQAGHLWHSWYWTSTGWQPWHEMEVPGSVGAFAAGETTELRQDLFVATDEDVQHRHCILEGSDSTEGTPPPPERNATWSPWQPFKKFPGGRIEQLGLATTGKHHLEAWAIDQAGGLWNSWLVDPDDWSEWSKFKTPGRVLSTAAGCRVDGHQDLFIATDDGISTCRHESRWGPWWDFQPQLDGRRVTRLGVSRLTAGHLELWALDGGGSLWHCWSRHQDEWQPWKQFDTPSPVVTFVAGQRADHRQELVVATDTGLYLSSYLADGEATRWEPWEGLPTASSEPG